MVLTDGCCVPGGLDTIQTLTLRDYAFSRAYVTGHRNATRHRPIRTTSDRLFFSQREKALFKKLLPTRYRIAQARWKKLYNVEEHMWLRSAIMDELASKK